MVAVISDMDQPLGQAVGNALEVKEAISTLRGRGPEDFTELCLTLGSQMLVCGGKSSSPVEAREMLLEAVRSGRALEKLADLAEAQGGRREDVYHPEHLPQASIQEEIPAPASGYIRRILCDVARGVLVEDGLYYKHRGSSNSPRCGGRRSTSRVP